MRNTLQSLEPKITCNFVEKNISSKNDLMTYKPINLFPQRMFDNNSNKSVDLLGIILVKDEKGLSGQMYYSTKHFSKSQIQTLCDKIRHGLVSISEFVI